MHSQDPNSPTHELVVLKNGDFSLRNITSGEVMHSNVGPEQEATLLYVEQSSLAERLKIENAPPLVLFDIGLGAATNALASLHVARGKPRKFHLISFESDLSGLRLAFENRAKRPFFEGFEEAIESLLEKKQWSQGNIKWELHEGHFRETVLRTPAPELIFFDFYSPRATPDLWDVSMFKLLREKCEVKARSGLPSTLFTYSASTRVRVAMLVAGWFVGYGRATGEKYETTMAATYVSELPRPLDARWRQRFCASTKRIPYNWPENEEKELENLVLAHPQFTGTLESQ